MKDKRQRMALAWPYAVYTDPAFAASLLQAAAASTGYAPYSYYHALRYAPYPLRPQPNTPTSGGAGSPGATPFLSPPVTSSGFLRPASLTPPNEPSAGGNASNPNALAAALGGHFSACLAHHGDPAGCRCALFPPPPPLSLPSFHAPSLAATLKGVSGIHSPEARSPVSHSPPLAPAARSPPTGATTITDTPRQHQLFQPYKSDVPERA